MIHRLAIATSLAAMIVGAAAVAQTAAAPAASQPPVRHVQAQRAGLF